MFFLRIPEASPFLGLFADNIFLIPSEDDMAVSWFFARIFVPLLQIMVIATPHQTDVPYVIWQRPC